VTRADLKDLARNTYRDAGDALAGEQIIAQARKISRTLVVAGTSTHQIQQVILRSNALCVIDRAFRLIERPLRLKE